MKFQNAAAGVITLIFMIVVVYLIDFILVQQLITVLWTTDSWLRTVIQFGAYFIYLVCIVGVPLLIATQE